MNKLLILSVSLVSFIANSQESTIKTGTYKSHTEGAEIILNINEDKTYEMVFFHGTYTTENDTIKFENTGYKNGKFVVEPVVSSDYSSSLKIRLEGKSYSYFGSNIYIGTQKNSNIQVEYKPISDYMEEADMYDYSKKIVIEVPKGQYLYFVDRSYNKTEITKYEITDDINELAVTYNPYSFADFKLVGYMEEDTKKLAVTADKKAILFFHENDEDEEITKGLTAVSIETDNDWAKNNGFDDDQMPYDYSYGEPSFNFKHAVDKKYDDALKTLEKSPSKFLVISFDLQNEKNESEFKDFIASSEEILSSYMYEGYNAEYDRYNFYLATEKDKAILSKHNIKSTKEIIVLNSKGDLLYHTFGSLTDNSAFFGPYSLLPSHLEKANQSLSIDLIIRNKKSTIAELTSVFKKASTISPIYSEDYSASLYNQEPEYVIEESIKEEDTTEDTVVESVTVGDYYAIKDKDNLYTIKSSKEAVSKEWQKVIEHYTDNKLYDVDFGLILKKELSKQGFMKQLFNDNSIGLSDIDFKLLDYVYQNHEKIIADENMHVSENMYSEYYDDEYTKAITSILADDVFSYQNSSLEYLNDQSRVQKTLKYYKTYLDVFKPNSSAQYNYLNALAASSSSDDLNIEYINAYESFYNSVIAPNSNIIESLDADYSIKTEDDYSGWDYFKETFATQANSVAWHVVENDKNGTYVKKAIKWSETSLLIDKTNHYYLDTLAQLYYKDGQKEKAIITEQKAIDTEGNEDNKSEYELVLAKMKNGTY